jgi:putative phage-type endonuclease
MATEFFKRLVCTEGLTKLDWLKWRQKGIGGSDISSVCNINPFHSSLALYYDKVTEITEVDEGNVSMEIGTALEPLGRAKFEKWINKNEGINIEVVRIPYILQHPTNLIALANLDGLFPHPGKGDCLLEIKTTAERNYKDWEEDSLPDYYYLQTQWYLYVTNYQYCYLAFFIGNRKFDVKLIERNEEVIKQIVEKADYFWNNFVIPRVPPAPSGDESSKEALAMMYPKEEVGKIISIEGEEYLQALNKLEQLKLAKKEAELGIEEANQIFKAKMGNAEIAICGVKKITWSEQERKEYTVKASKSRVFRISNYKGGEK